MTLALFWGVMWFGVVDLLVVVVQDERFHEFYLLESGWGLLYLVLVTVPLVVLAVRPGEPAALAQVAVCAVAVLAGGLWALEWPQVATGLGLAVTVAVLASLGGASPPARAPVDPPLGVLAGVALVGAVVYAVPLVSFTPFFDEVTNGVRHAPMQASLGLAVAGCTALAAVGRRRLPAACAAFCTAWLGVESLVYPDLVGSLGAWGWAALAWTAAVVGSLSRPA